MKVWKKNLVAAAVLVTVCAGIYVNWMYTEDKAADNLTDTLDYEKVMNDDSLVLSEDMAAIAAGEAVKTISRRYACPVSKPGITRLISYRRQSTITRKMDLRTLSLQCSWKRLCRLR